MSKHISALFQYISSRDSTQCQALNNGAESLQLVYSNVLQKFYFLEQCRLWNLETAGTTS